MNTSIRLKYENKLNKTKKNEEKVKQYYNNILCLHFIEF